ncbi:MAG: retropepsin-like aspartic protease [Sulfuritalea sp.]|nr:retropepsin-like aspartic protease [Sulfuritalea sp.]
MIYPGQSAAISAPVGDYGIQFAWGTQWCSSAIGFRNPHVVNIRSLLASLAGETKRIVVDSAPETESGLRFELQLPQPSPGNSLSNQDASTPVVLQSSPSFLTLRADSLGHYRIGGSINGRAVNFLIDTGASTSAVSRRFANEAPRWPLQTPPLMATQTPPGRTVEIVM